MLQGVFLQAAYEPLAELIQLLNAFPHFTFGGTVRIVNRLKSQLYEVLLYPARRLRSVKFVDHSGLGHCGKSMLRALRKTC